MSTRTRVKHPTGCRRNRKVRLNNEHTSRRTFLLVLQGGQVSRAVPLPMAVAVAMETLSFAIDLLLRFCLLLLWSFYLLLFHRLPFLSIRLSFGRSPFHSKNWAFRTFHRKLSGNQYIHQLGQGILKFMHMVIHDELSICISQGLQNNIILQVQV